MKKYFLFAAMALTMCENCIAQNTTSSNPLLSEFTTTYQLPPYSDITIDHFREGYLKGIEEAKSEIKALVNNTEKPTFENTILALEDEGELLTRVLSAFSPFNSSNSTDESRALSKEMLPKMSELSDSIYLNDKLFQRVKTLHDNQASLNLTKEQAKLLDNYYKRFVRNGALLDAEKKEQLSKLNREISMLQLQFGQNLLHETNNTFVTVENLEELDGLPQINIDAAAVMAKNNGQEGKWMFNMQRPSCNPVLQFCTNRDLRKKVYDAYYNRGNQGNEYDNNAISVQLLKLRLQKANLLGYKDYASYALEDRMAKSSENVYNLLDQVWKPAVEKAKEELDDIRAEIKKEGKDFEPEGWDYRYYLDKAKQAKYAIDENELKPYLAQDSVQKGIFYVAGKLFGLTFKERTDLPKYDPDTKTFEVYDKDGSLLAIFYSDYIPRDGKNAGAWCSAFRGEKYKDGKRVIPVVVNVANLATPNGDVPPLESIDNVVTMFHEFGHALHSFMKDVQYMGTSGVERDFVEVPSQLDEHWAFEPEVLNVYAKHYQTGETIPMDVVKKIEESGKYGQGFDTVELVAAMFVDMDMHVLTEIPDDFNVMEFEEKKMAERGIPKQILPRYRVTNFSHTMGGGYTAGYYSYMWAEVYECDAYQAFKETGDIFNQEVANKYRTYIFAPGGIDDGMTMYRNFRGKDPDVTGVLLHRGLK